MDKKTLTIIAVVLVVAIVAVAAISVSQRGGDDGGQDGTTAEKEEYTFTDANGIECTVQVPLENVSVVHKYIPMFLKMLGVEDEVAGLDNTYGMTFQRYFENSFDIGDFSNPDGETMLAHGSKVILTPITMGLSNGDALEAMGIQVIYIDVTDPYVIPENLEILAHLFGFTDEIKANYDRYMELYNECFDYVEQFDFSGTADADFCLYMSSSGFYQTHQSAAVKVVEHISGKSYTHMVDPDVKDTVYFYQEPSVIYNFDGEHGLDYLFLYSMDTPELNLQKFIDSGNDIDLTEMSCFQNHHVYALSTDCVNGLLSCVSLILYAEAFGADTGEKAEEIIQGINDAFGLDYSTEDLLVEVSGLV